MLVLLIVLVLSMKYLRSFDSAQDDKTCSIRHSSH